MKNLIPIICIAFHFVQYLPAQGKPDSFVQREIEEVINAYSRARTNQDSVLLGQLLTTDIDQLVSSGVWRRGKAESMLGMGRSSENNPGTRTLTVENTRLLTGECAIADARYIIQNDDGSARNMWSTFLLVRTSDGWKISAIRNMLPAN